MCRNVTIEQRIEGWRAFVAMLSELRDWLSGVAAGILRPTHSSPFGARARRSG